MLEYFFELYQDLPRQGPGSDAITRRALAALRSYLPPTVHLLDVGCGAGTQTLCLAENLPGSSIIAIDTHQPFLDTVLLRAQQAGHDCRIQTLNMSMLAIDLPDESFHLIWSEGAIYIMGFSPGLEAWRRLLLPGGCLAVSEITWLTDSRPAELEAYWRAGYPAITTQTENIQTIQQAGYDCLDSFILPPDCWQENYYLPMTRQLDIMRQKYPDNPQARTVLEEHQQEIDLYNRFGDYYSYAFYLLRKPL